MGSTAFGRSVFTAIAVNFVFCSAVGAQVQPIRINCGGPNFTGTDGVTWQADRYYVSGGNLYTSDLVQGTPDLMLYRAGRYSLYTDFYYQIPVANGSYRVKLKFAEIQYYTAGSRVFHVDLNGTRVLTNFDIVQQAGAARFATDREFTANVTNGQIRLDFIGVFRRGLINAIEITSLGVAGPSMSVAPSALSFAATAGGGNPAAQGINVAITGGSLNWTASANQPWLAVAPASGSASAVAAVSVNTASLAAGTHTGAVTFTANGVSQTVNVTLNLAAPPSLSVAPAALSYNANLGGANPAAQPLTVTVTSPPVAWTASSNQSWLTVSPVSGSTSATLTASVNIASLGAGTYTGAISVNSSLGLRTVPVTLNITSLPSLSLSPGAMTFTGPSGGTNPSPQQAAITIANGSANWTAASSQPWLLVSPASGSASGVITVSVNAASLAAGSHNGTITVTAPGAGGSPAVVNVTLTLTSPPGSAQPIRINSGGPDYTGPAGTFLSDRHFSGGGNYYTSDGILGTGDLQLYRSARYGVYTDFYYQVPIANGSYRVKLKFAEIQFWTVGSRRFHVDANGARVLPNFDIVQQAGAARTAVDREFVVDVTGGQIRLDFIGVTGRGLVNAIEITPLAAAVSSMSVAPAALAFSGPGTQQVAVSITNGPLSWTAAANQPWLSVTPAAGTASGNVAVAVNAASLTPGTHTGAVTITANGSTQTVNVTVNIATLSLAPGSLTFNGSGTQQATVTVTNGPLSWTAAANQPWLSVTPAAGTASGNVAVAVNAASLAPGTHTANITFNANGASQTVTVTLNLSALTVAPGSLTFIGPTGGTQPAPKGATVFLSGAPTTWTAQTSQPWLQVSPASGTASAEVLISAITTGLATGVYTGAVNFNAPGAAGSPGVLSVTLHVAPQLSATPGGLAYFATAGGAAPSSQTFLVQPTAANVPWTIVKQRPWVTISPVAGVGPGTVTVSVNHSGLAQGIYNDVIVVSASDNTNAPADVFLSLNVSAAQSGPRDFYVSPTGLPGNDGSLGAPWDLVTALAHPQAVRPGDRIWVRGGIYGNGQNTFFNRLAGSAGSPILLRNYPGERATINGYIQVGCCDGNPDPSQGANVWVWGLEFMNTNPDRTGCSAGPPCWGATPSRPGVDVWAPGARLINNIIHDTTQGVGWWKESTDSELYGNLIYYNGYQAPDRAHGHGVYSQNGTGLKKLLDNILFDQFGFGMHLYGSSASLVRNYLIEGNISFNNGAISTNSHVTDNLLVAGGAGDAGGITVRNNHFYYVPERDLGRSELGFAFSVQNQDLIATNNHFIGGYESAALWRWQSVTFTGNTVYARTWTKIGLDTGTVPFSNYLWDNNTYYGASNFRINGLWREYSIWRSTSGFDANSVNNQSDPTGVWVFARPNAYETGRGHVVVYNWTGQSQVMADLSAILTPGMAFEIRDAQNFFATPVAAGVYAGGPVAIPMTGLSAAAPVGAVPTAPVHPGPRFATFVVLPQGTAPILR
ncbi:MAG: malectin domain-containing carbohydrate-binding protein [Bryobacteraceae bacterium]|nr:malectin domain-containing carbohydrate-binding protein [Bryobacteraceae bacterium]